MIEVHPAIGDPVERCCFCREHTKHWYKPNDVACCVHCAKQAEPEDVPTKKQWFRREVIAIREWFV